MELKDLEKQLSGIEAELKKFIDKHAEEVKTNGTASAETKAALDKLGTQHTETAARLLVIEQKLTAPGGNTGQENKSFGQMVVESDGFKALQSGQKSSGRIDVGSFHKTAIVNTTGQNQPLVPDYRVPGIMMPMANRRLTIRDLIPSNPISSNLVQYTRELVFTNSAAMQTGGSPNSGENIAKAESGITFELANAAVQTLAHWIPASRQILDDAPALAGYINSRLMYGLKLEEENQLLNGGGTGNDLSGLVLLATDFDTTDVNSSTDTYIDILRRAITQVGDSEFQADGFVLNPHDWETIQLVKTTGTASSGEYVFSNPHVVEADRIWGLPVVPTNSMTRGQFLCGAFSQGAGIWDRTGATIEVSREHASFFIQNMVAILCEERLALTVYRPKALIYGGFPYGS